MHNTRKAAAEAGATKFHTGRPCKYGHVADRFTSTGNCCECLAANRREFAEALKASRSPTNAERGTLFTYRLHPEDHAAALAFCQALDLQRGRTPATGQAVAAVIRNQSDER